MNIKTLYTTSFLVFTLLVIPTLAFPFVMRAQSKTVSNSEAQSEADSASIPLPTHPADLANASKARIIFKLPLSVSEVAKLAASKGLYVEMLEGEFTVGSVPLYDFYPVQQQVNPETLEADYARSRLAYFADSLQEEAYLTEEQRKSLGPQLQAMKMAIQRQDAGPIRIQKATFSGNASTIQALSKNDVVDQVNVINNEQQSKTTSPTSNPQSSNNKIERTPKKTSQTESTVSVNAAITQALPSVPRYGTSYTYPSSVSGQRYTRQYMKWEWISFASNQTYEHALRFDNFDGKTYLNNGTTAYPGCFPVITYAATSWPSSTRAYVDTRASGKGVYCDTGELEFTIGAFQANVLQANTWYDNYIRTTNGNTSNDRFYLTEEIGHQDPSACPSGQEVWCSSYPDKIVDNLQAWNTEVPGTKQWQLGVRFCENNREGGYGRCLDLRPGTHDLTEYNFNDVLTTIRIGQGIQWRVTVYEHVNPSTNYCYGSGWIFTSGGGRWEINLYENNLNFNDKASCAIVEFK